MLRIWRDIRVRISCRAAKAVSCFMEQRIFTGSFLMIFMFAILMPCLPVYAGGRQTSHKDAQRIAGFVGRHHRKISKDSKASPYQSCRIVIKTEDADGLTSSRAGAQALEDAIDSLYLSSYQEYILQYADEAHTRSAYRAFRKLYGDSCYVDEILSQDDLMALDETDAETEDTEAENAEIEDTEIEGLEMADSDEQDSDTEADVYSGLTLTSDQMTWGYDYMNLSHLLADSQGAEKVTIAIIDSGCDMDNWYFDNCRSKDSGAREALFSADSYDLVEEDSDPQDESSNGHGTHIAGLMAACSDENVSLMILRVFDSNGQSTQLLIDTAIQYAIDHDADVINMSLSKSVSDGEVVTCWDDAIDRAYEEGIPVCCASGNNAAKGETILNNYPACYEKTISVGAIDTEGCVADFSCGGALLDFCAPGKAIISAKNGASSASTKKLSGTSQATAHVSLALAYIKANNPDADMEELYQLALTQCLDLGEEGRDDSYGQGCLVFSCDHSYETTMSDASCTEAGISRSLCSLCGMKKVRQDEALGHAFESYTQPATETEDGYECLLCSRCGLMKDKVILPATGSQTDTTEEDRDSGEDTGAEGDTKTEEDKKTEEDQTEGDKKDSETRGETSKTNGAADKVTETTKKAGQTQNVTKSSVVKYKISRPTGIKIRRLSCRRYRITWKKVSRATYYEIQFSSSRSFRKAVKIYKVKQAAQKKLKKVLKKKKACRRYYIRIRTVYKKNGKKYYSAWSKIYKR